MLATARNVPGSHRDSESVPAWEYTASGEQLTPALERHLIRRARSGDSSARERLLSANVPLVVSITRQYRSRHLEAEDLVQEGMIGLHTAIERFDPELGYRFSTYATYWIKQRVLRALDRNGRLIRVPVDVGYAARRAQQLRAEAQERSSREPALEELAPECGVSVQRLKAVLECLEEPLSLDATGDDGAATRALEIPDLAAAGPEDALLRAEGARELDALLATLPDRDRLVLEGRFGLRGYVVSLSDLADALRMTREGVRQIQRRALLKLRRRLALAPATA
jgi:RNA polymerase primary sigma factor